VIFHCSNLPKDIFKKLGIVPPEQTPKLQRVEWKDWLAWCKTIKDAGLIPLSMSAGWRLFMHPVIMEYERTVAKWDTLYDGTNKVKYSEQPEVKAAWTETYTALAGVMTGLNTSYSSPPLGGRG
jgi:ABC-type glycerol-3-phosphate transport system substrate-binding protein